jgi:hypothetical protein
MEDRLTMLSKARLELSVLGAAVVMGILADALLRTMPWGLNFFVWMAALSAVITFHARWRAETLSGGGQWLLVVVALFALGLVWHDSGARQENDGKHQAVHGGARRSQKS